MLHALSRHPLLPHYSPWTCPSLVTHVPPPVFAALQGWHLEVEEQGESGERVLISMKHRLQRSLDEHAEAGRPYDWVLLLGGINDLGGECRTGGALTGCSEGALNQSDGTAMPCCFVLYGLAIGTSAESVMCQATKQARRAEVGLMADLPQGLADLQGCLVPLHSCCAA